jgi:hypothetical protein
MMFPEHRIVVAVTSNISYADTFGIALGIAQAFAHKGKSGDARWRSGDYFALAMN